MGVLARSHPTTRIAFQLGAALQWGAGVRAMQPGIGVLALVVDAKDETAAAFYRHHGFVGFSSNPVTFVLPIASLARKD